MAATTTIGMDNMRERKYENNKFSLDFCSDTFLCRYLTNQHQRKKEKEILLSWNAFKIDFRKRCIYKSQQQFSYF